MPDPRMTRQTFTLLLILSRQSEASGADLARESGFKSGTLYPILLRLEAAGWLASRWEEGEPASLGRPRRRYYRITAIGQHHMASERATMEGLFGQVAMT